MARFGRVTNGNALGRADTIPNALFDLAEADHAAQRTRLNALLLDGGAEGQGPGQASGQGQAQPVGAHPLFGGMDDAARQTASQRLDATSRTAMALLALPAGMRPAAYGTARQHLLDNGLAASLPEEYPGDAALEVFARQGVAAGQQLRTLMAPPMATPGSAPAAPAGTRAEGAGAPGFADRVVAAESGGDPAARNPRSSAVGAGQFLEGTWLGLLPQVRPDLAAGRTREEVLALRDDPALSRQMVDAYAARNAGALRRAGIAPDDAALMLAHRFGAGGAAGVLRADPAAPAASVLGPEVLASNPDLRGLSVAALLAQARRRAGLTPDAEPTRR